MNGLLRVVGVILLPCVCFACTPLGDPSIDKKGFSDSFDRTQLGDAWRNTGGPYEIQQGQLHVRGAVNHPLWLKRILPRDARIEFEARSTSPEGDIKVEVFGDGVSKATATSYTATSYVVIFGGWNNSLNVLARLDEHGADRVVGSPRRVESGHTYRFRIERKSARVSVWVDGELLMEMTDPSPLEGRGHDHFGINNWQSDLWFDNVRITPL